MKKLLFSSFLATAALFTACNKESYYHTMGVSRPEGVSVLYADQVRDTIEFMTTDSYVMTSDVPWLTVPDSMRAAQIPNYYRNVWIVTSPLVVEPNVTGQIRTGRVTVRCVGNDDWDQTATATFQQWPWLDITSPVPNYAYNDNLITNASFQLTDSATQASDVLRFHVYGEWELTDGNFVHPATLTGEAGTHSVTLDVEPNPTTADRQDMIVLTSNGVSTSVTVKQKGRKETES